MKQSAESKSKAGQRTNCNCQEHDKEKKTSYVPSFNTQHKEILSKKGAKLGA